MDNLADFVGLEDPCSLQDIKLAIKQFCILSTIFYCFILLFTHSFIHFILFHNDHSLTFPYSGPGDFKIWSYLPVMFAVSFLSTPWREAQYIAALGAYQNNLNCSFFCLNELLISLVVSTNQRLKPEELEAEKIIGKPVLFFLSFLVSFSNFIINDRQS